MVESIKKGSARRLLPTRSQRRSGGDLLLVVGFFVSGELVVFTILSSGT
jgi:hypothetical protein